MSEKQIKWSLVSTEVSETYSKEDIAKLIELSELKDITPEKGYLVLEIQESGEDNSIRFSLELQLEYKHNVLTSHPIISSYNSDTVWDKYYKIKEEFKS